jgi:molybdopterin-guanine dinucleotide biosynthesis protein A
MGQDKALLPFRGRPLACAVAGEVLRAAGSATLIGDPDRYRDLGFPVIRDLYPGEGPLGGILTALQHSNADQSLVVACDMPELSAEFLAGLLAEAAQRPGILIPQGPSGLLEPLCAVWPAEARSGLEAAFARGVRKVRAALEGLPVHVYPVAEVAPFQNVNTPEDFAGHAAS